MALAELMLQGNALREVHPGVFGCKVGTLPRGRAIQCSGRAYIYRTGMQPLPDFPGIPARFTCALGTAVPSRFSPTADPSVTTFPQVQNEAWVGFPFKALSSTASTPTFTMLSFPPACPQALAELSLADNRLASLPAALSGASSLARLHLFGNALARLPVGQLASLPSLSDLWLEGNPGLDAGDLGRLVQAAGAGGMPRLKALGIDQQQVGCCAEGADPMPVAVGLLTKGR